MKVIGERSLFSTAADVTTKVAKRSLEKKSALLIHYRQPHPVALPRTWLKKHEINALKSF
jgi:hypothetical protein